jgi:hypothetical protein
MTSQCNSNKKTENFLCNFYEKVKDILVPKSTEIISSGYKKYMSKLWLAFIYLQAGLLSKTSSTLINSWNLVLSAQWVLPNRLQTIIASWRYAVPRIAFNSVTSFRWIIFLREHYTYSLCIFNKTKKIAQFIIFPCLLACRFCVSCDVDVFSC